MAIDKSNYERFLIDYLDGNLNPIEVAELILFLENHPEIKNEFTDSFNVGQIEIPVLEFPDKSRLKRSLSNPALLNDTITYSLIRKLEEDLTAVEEDELNTLILANPSIERENKLIQQTKLQADLTISFPKKDSLKRTPVIPLYRKYAAVAAILLLFISIPLFDNFLEPEITQPITGQIYLKPKSSFPELSNAASSNRVLNTATIINKAAVKYSANQKDELRAHSNSCSNFNQPTKVISIIPDDQLALSTNKMNNDTILSQVDFYVENITLNKDLASNTKPTEDQPYLSWKEIAENKIRNYSKENLTEEGKQLETKKRLNSWEIVAVGAKLVSKLSGKKIQIKNKYDENGDLKAFAILSSNFEFSRSR